MGFKGVVTDIVLQNYIPCGCGVQGVMQAQKQTASPTFCYILVSAFPDAIASIYTYDSRSRGQNAEETNGSELYL